MNSDTIDERMQKINKMTDKEIEREIEILQANAMLVNINIAIAEIEIKKAQARKINAEAAMVEKECKKL